LSCQWYAPRSLRLKYSGKNGNKREFIVYFLAAVAVVLSMACYQKFKVKVCQMETGRKWSREREREKKSKITIFHEVAAKKCNLS
jgi:hypothetical protein